MTEEEKMAIDNSKKLVKLRKNKAGDIKHDTCICSTKDLDTILNLIQKLQEEIEITHEKEIFYKSLSQDNDYYAKELEKKDKIIDLMARELCFVFDSECQECCKECEQDIDTASNCIIQYFENKAEQSSSISTIQEEK